MGTGAGDISPNTLDNYRWALGLASSALGKYRLMDLEPDDVEKSLLKALAKKGMSRSSIIRVRTCLAKALDKAMSRGKVSRNAARLAEMPKTQAPPEKRALTVDQAEALLKAAEGHPLEALVVVGLMTGLRPGELLGLRWDDVDLEGCTLAVTGSLKREGSTLRLGDVKGGLGGPGGNWTYRGGRSKPCALTGPPRASRGSSSDRTGRTMAWCSPARSARRCTQRT